MRRIEFPDGWYADARPSGEYVVLVRDQHMLTHLGTIAFPDMDRQPLFPRVSPSGPFKFAGQSHYTSDTLEWNGSWRIIPTTACGVSAVIYDNTGQLHIADCGPPTGSQGWRYVDPNGRFVTGDETYGPSDIAPSLFEWTDLSQRGDTLVVGQGNEDGAWVWNGRQHIELATGNCRFIRASRVGDDVSIAIWRIGDSTVIYWGTVGEFGITSTSGPLIQEPTVTDDPTGIQGYGFRPFSEFFQRYNYTDTSVLGRSGLRLRDVMRGFVRPSVEVSSMGGLVVSPTTGPGPDDPIDIPSATTVDPTTPSSSESV